MNTQHRDIAFKRAAEVLAWREVMMQLTDDTEDELKDARAKHDEVLDKLRRDIERAFQHYAYLMRAGDLHVEFKRFDKEHRTDEDRRTALNGGHVWTALVDAGRATQPGTLDIGYLAALLDDFDRALTPREIVQSFYKNPAFPLVTSTDEIRQVLYQLITDDWELVDADGDRLAVSSPGQISINSINQTVRRRAHEPPSPAPVGIAPSGDDHQQPGGQLRGQQSNDGQQASGGQQPQPTRPTVYMRYRLQLANKSITGGDARDQAWQLLQELRKIIDPATNADHQLLSFDLTLVTAEGEQGAIEAKAKALGAQVIVEADDF